MPGARFVNGRIVRDGDEANLLRRARSSRREDSNGSHSEKVYWGIGVCLVLLLVQAKRPGGVLGLVGLNGGISTAMDREPEEHVAYFVDHVGFVREQISQADKRLVFGTEEEKAAGGFNGENAEDVDLRFASPEEQREYLRVTRCSTTRWALASYYCGTDAAVNMGLGRRGGLAQFRDVLDLFEEQRLAGFNQSRLVFFFGLGNGAGNHDLDHVWTVVAQPNGRFLWLQSFISQYSLETWIGKRRYDMSPEALLAAVGELERLEKATAWDAATDGIYKRLFDVSIVHDLRKHQTAVEFVNAGLEVTFEVGCEYPTPSSSTLSTEKTEQQEHRLRDEEHEHAIMKDL